MDRGIFVIAAGIAAGLLALAIVIGVRMSSAAINTLAAIPVGIAVLLIGLCIKWVLEGIGGSIKRILEGVASIRREGHKQQEVLNDHRTQSVTINYFLRDEKTGELQLLGPRRDYAAEVRDGLYRVEEGYTLLSHHVETEGE